MGHKPNEEFTTVISDVLRRAPDWLRRDLCSGDPLTRRGAEDTLAIMIASVIPCADR